jgi:RecA-family ATPase
MNALMEAFPVANAMPGKALAKREIEILSVDELLHKQFPAGKSMLGSNLLDKSGALLISGPQKIGKSLFAAQLALSLSDRRAFLNMPVGDATYRVLILQAEVSAKRMQQRFTKQVAGFSPEAQSRVLNASVFSSVKLDTKDGFGLVMQWLEKHEPELLIIDPLANFHTGDENEAQDMSRLTRAFDDIRCYGIAVGLVHHHGK